MYKLKARRKIFALSTISAAVVISLSSATVTHAANVYEKGHYLVQVTINNFSFPKIDAGNGVSHDWMREDVLHVDRWGAGAITFGNDGHRLDYDSWDVEPIVQAGDPAGRPIAWAQRLYPVGKSFTETADGIDYIRITGDFLDNDMASSWDQLCTGTWKNEPPRIDQLVGKDHFSGTTSTTFNGDGSCAINYTIKVLGINPHD
ncbi:hypothetical protein [Streptomyces collinus]|uniref:hypothetical protein n=1 Tax=Streptomyces collinus TaxID=42684 RepID=UPI0036E95360